MEPWMFVLAVDIFAIIALCAIIIRYRHIFKVKPDNSASVKELIFERNFWKNAHYEDVAALAKQRDILKEALIKAKEALRDQIGAERCPETIEEGIAALCKIDAALISVENT